ncbi:hypothetical protein CNMCM8980_010234 [Aspergillus fumigatiaffinis]|uniref:NAD dependent epimerase/dehydratase n=1 Tax=Aspergillus fumigatiaffinis TaxID=340414 RepID=A0A8H4M8R3_9EURO|nr:hypothetical protein CNMCM6805_009174 [Aspergillus fumigatiaffinis]KAF4244362.1 hypothetical protein CNMCM8980_010234 [Aspergillus fumigatiaffinis]
MSRLIDKVPAPKNPLKMEILLLGMPRTGTISIRMAFEILKYRPFHGRMMDEMPHLYPLWTEALEARYLHTGKDYTRADYDKLFDGFNVSCNIPGTLVAAELIMAYPEAKVVVSTRDVDRWQQSMRQSVDSAVSWKSFDWLAPWDPHVIGPWWKYHKFQHRLRPLIAPQGERQAYLDYYAWIQKAVPADNLLVFNPRDGWEPLCQFLGVPIPDEPFPHVNNTEQFLNGRRRRWWRTVGLLVAKVSAPVLAVVAAAWWSWGRKSTFLVRG